MHICYIYNMSRRTSIILDQESEDAARELARIYGCSSSEAIRRAVVRQHDLLKGLPSKAIKERKKVLFRLFELILLHTQLSCKEKQSALENKTKDINKNQ